MPGSVARQNGSMAQGVEPAGTGGGKGVDRRRQAWLIAVGIAVILLVWFAVANFRRVPIEFWIYKREAPLIVVIVISGLLGALITFLLMRRRARDTQ